MQTKTNIITSLCWKFFERCGVQVIQFIISVIIARILDPDDYGVLAIATVFLSLSIIFIQAGLSTALIQKKEVSVSEYSSVFFYCLITSALFYILLFALAPLAGNYFDMPKLSLTLRLLSLSLFSNAFTIILNAIVSREMTFYMQFYSSLGAVILSGGIGITAAYAGIGIFALILQHLTFSLFTVILLAAFVKWKPVASFSLIEVSKLMRYGVRLLGAGLVDTLFHNLESLVIGKKYNSETLAHYNKGSQFPLIVIDSMDGSIQSVMLPVYSNKQENLAEIKRAVRSTVSLCTYFVFPVMAGLASVAEPMIQLVLGDKWLPCVPFLQIYCITSALFPIQTASMQAFKAIGKSNVYLYIIAAKRAVSILLLCAAVFFFDSVAAIAAATVFFEIAGIIFTAVANKKILDYNVAEMLSDTVMNAMLSLLMLASVIAAGTIPFDEIFAQAGVFVVMTVQIIIGIAVYFALSALTHNNNFNTAVGYIKSIFQKNT